VGHGNGGPRLKNVSQAEGERLAPWFLFGRLEQHAFDEGSVLNDGHPCSSRN
jgi:hypothetical protein